MAGILKVDQVQSDSNLAFAIAGSNVAFMNATSLQMVGSNVSLAGTNVITNGKVVASAQPIGAVLQVVQATYSTTTTSSTGAEQDTGLTATITPTSASSKILVLVSQADCAKVDVQGPISLFLYRNSTAIYTITSQLLYQSPGASTRFAVNCSGSYLDSPATTSAVTYKTTFTSSSGSTTRIQFGGTPSTIQLLEIAA